MSSVTSFIIISFKTQYEHLYIKVYFQTIVCNFFYVKNYFCIDVREDMTRTAIINSTDERKTKKYNTSFRKVRG